MQNEKIKERLNYVRIVGRGVDALEDRKEYNNNAPVSAELLRKSINKVKNGVFSGFKQLATVASGRSNS